MHTKTYHAFTDLQDSKANSITNDCSLNIDELPQKNGFDGHSLRKWDIRFHNEVRIKFMNYATTQQSGLSTFDLHSVFVS